MMKGSRLKLEISLVCKTALHIGSGETAVTSDAAVIKTATGEPFIPGSTLKGKLRSAADSIAHYLSLKTCQLNYSYSGVECCSALDWYRNKKKEIDLIRKETDAKKKLRKIDEFTCDVCQLFGSPLRAGRIFISDAKCTDWTGIFEVRDGVVIDRDSETAVDNLKFNFEVVPADTKFHFTIEIEEFQDKDLALIGSVLLSWQQGFMLGGMTARGLGRMEIEEITASKLDLNDKTQLIDYLLHKKMEVIPDWKAYFQERIEQHVKGVS